MWRSANCMFQALKPRIGGPFQSKGTNSTCARPGKPGLPSGGGHSYTGTISVSTWLWRDNATSTSGIRILCALWETICDETELVATKIFHRHSDGLLCVKEGSDGGAIRERTGAHGVLFNILPRDIPIRALPEAGECKHYLHHISHGFRLRAAIRWSTSCEGGVA